MESIVNTQPIPENERPVEAGVAWSPSTFATLAIGCSCVAALCFGISFTREWVVMALQRNMAFQGWPRPHGIDWTNAFLDRQRLVLSNERLFHNAGWITFFFAVLFLIRSLSSNIPFIVPGQAQRKNARDWMAVWVDPRLVVRGIVATVLSFWLLGIPHLFAGSVIVNTETRRVLFGGPRFFLYNLPLNPTLVHLCTCVFIMAGLFVVWSSDGLFTFEPFDVVHAMRAAIRGLVAGVALAVTSYPFTGNGINRIRIYLLANGIMDSSAYWLACMGTFLAAGICGIAFALSILGLSKLSLSFLWKFIAIAAVAGVGATQWVFSSVVLGHGLDAGKRLDEVMGAHHPEETRRLVVLTGNVPRPPSTEVLWQSQAQVDPSQETTKRVEQWLNEKKHRTTLSQSAFMHLFDVAALDFDRTREIRTCLDNLRQHPVFRPAQGLGRLIPQAWPLIMEILPDITVSQENRKVLSEITDGNFFQFDDSRQAATGLGDAWFRLGDVKKARELYHRAGLSEDEVAAKVSTQMVRDGSLKGTLQVDGKPVQNVRVGLVSTLRWLELVPPSGLPNAYSLRVVCTGTRTDSEGHFELTGIPSGEYYLVVVFTPEQIRPSDEVVATPQPGVIRIGPAKSYDFGTIQVNPVAPKPSNRKDQAV